MKLINTLNCRYCKVLFLTMFFLQASSQKIDTDSLLQVIIKDTRLNKNFEKNIKLGLLGKKVAPKYLDYYLLLGRNHDLLKNKDSARFYYNYYINKAIANEDAYNYLINLELESQNFADAEILINSAIQANPQNKVFEKRKLAVYQLQKDTKKEYEYLKVLQSKYPNDDNVRQLLIQSSSRFISNRIGATYSFTTFDRQGVGPWHLTGLQFIRERDWGSLIGNINYANRLSAGQSIANGMQYELESFVFIGKNSYSYGGVAYSNSNVFPNLRLGYSFFQNFKKGWEGDIGIRYLEAQDDKFTTAVIGVGKYIGSYWINLRTFLQAQNCNFYPAGVLNVRYYFDSRFDYISFITGYGSSPEDRSVLGQFTQRVSLNSYRIGGGYFKIFNNQFITGLQAGYNYQEYIPNKTQNEFELSLMLHYKF